MKSNVWIAPCLAPGTWSVLKALLLFSVAHWTPLSGYLGLVCKEEGWVLDPIPEVPIWGSSSQGHEHGRAVHLGLGRVSAPCWLYYNSLIWFLLWSLTSNNPELLNVEILFFAWVEEKHGFYKMFQHPMEVQSVSEKRASDYSVEQQCG